MAQSVLVLWLAMGCLTVVSGAFSWASETREVMSLEGVWNCYCEREGDSMDFIHHSGLQKLNGTVKMAVPGDLLDFIAQMDPKSCPGVIWYERTFFIPKNWQNSRIWLRLDGISSGTTVWINGVNLVKENKSHIPVECEVSDKVFFDWDNRIAFAVDTESLQRDNIQFPGMPQSVSLWTHPELLYIQSVSVNTTVENGTASITYKVQANGLLQQNRQCISVQVLDMDLTPVASATTCDCLGGTFSIPNCHLWWPMSVDEKPGYLYTLVFKLYYKYFDVVVRDVYRQKIGIRSLSWSNNSFMVNGKCIYLKGVETHEEWARKAFNAQLNLKDVALLKWLNTNILATKSAPSEKMLDLADELGLLVILGSPKSALEDSIVRYRNHPSVILWSLSMGENCYSNECEQKVIKLIDRGRALDESRPFTALIPFTAGSTPLVNKLDIVSVSLEDFNSGNGLSSNSFKFLQDDIQHFQKPAIIMYGDKCISTNSRIRTLQYDPFPELNNLHKCFDNLKRGGLVVGEVFGNLVAYDYYSDENFNLVDGIFNQHREPTTCAGFIRSKFRERRNPCSCRPLYYKNLKNL